MAGRLGYFILTHAYVFIPSFRNDATKKTKVSLFLVPVFKYDCTSISVSPFYILIRPCVEIM